MVGSGVFLSLSLFLFLLLRRQYLGRRRYHVGEKWRRGVEGLELQIPGGIGCGGVRSEILKKLSGIFQEEWGIVVGQ